MQTLVSCYSVTLKKLHHQNGFDRKRKYVRPQSHHQASKTFILKMSSLHFHLVSRSSRTHKCLVSVCSQVCIYHANYGQLQRSACNQSKFSFWCSNFFMMYFAPVSAWNHSSTMLYKESQQAAHLRRSPLIKAQQISWTGLKTTTTFTSPCSGTLLQHEQAESWVQLCFILHANQCNRVS